MASDSLLVHDVSPGSDVTSTRPAGTDAPIIVVRDLCKAFGGQQVLRHLSVELSAGSVVLLRGGNGSGKTTLLNILTGHLPADAGTISLRINGRREELSFPQAWWQSLNPVTRFTPERLARAGIGRTWQDVRLFGTQSVLDNVTAATPDVLGERPAAALLSPRRVRVQEQAARQAAGRLLAQLGLDADVSLSADRMSLGQSKRVAVARALQGGARVLFLDEPLAGLDGAGVTAMLDLLRMLAHREGSTLVIVEHAMNVRRMLDLATVVWTLQDGQIVPETPAAVEQELRAGEHSDAAFLCEPLPSHEWCSTRTDLPGGASLTTLRRRHAEAAAVPVLVVRDLVVRRNGRIILGKAAADGAIEGLSFQIHAGELGLLEAPNGWGKTTLLETLAGLLEPVRGYVEVNGRAVTGQPAWTRRDAGLSMVQARENAFPPLLVEEALRLCGADGSAAELLNVFRGRRVHGLSGGERQRLALACGRGRHGMVTLFDEPLAALDATAMANERAALLRGLERGAALVALPHGTM